MRPAGARLWFAAKKSSKRPSTRSPRSCAASTRSATTPPTPHATAVSARSRSKPRTKTSRRSPAAATTHRKTSGQRSASLENTEAHPRVEIVRPPPVDSQCNPPAFEETKLIAGRPGGGLGGFGGGARGKIALSGAHDESFAIHTDLDAAEFSVCALIRRHIGERILAAQFVADIEERLRQIVHTVGEEGAPAGLLSKLREHLVGRFHMDFPVAAFGRIVLLDCRNPLGTGADGVDDHPAALRHLDRS